MYYYATENISILKAYESIKEKKVTAIPVVSEDKTLLGLVTLKTIANELVSGNFNKMETSYQNIIEVLNGKEVIKFDEEIKGNIFVGAYGSDTIIENIKLDRKSILIVGNRNEIIDYLEEK